MKISLRWLGGFRWLAEDQIKGPEDLRAFGHPGRRFLRPAGPGFRRFFIGFPPRPQGPGDFPPQTKGAPKGETAAGSPPRRPGTRGCGRPGPGAVYYPDKTLVFGHTPTRLLYQQAGEPGQPDRMFRRGGMIGIGCGCAYPGGRLGCLCLDTVEEFYVQVICGVPSFSISRAFAAAP